MNRPGADTRHKEQFDKICRPPFRHGRERAMQAAGDHVGRTKIVMRQHDEMRQRLLPCGRRWLLPPKGRNMPDDAIRPEAMQEIQLASAR